MTHTYASLADWKNYARDQGVTAMWTAGTSNDDVVLGILEAVSERIDEWCQRSAFRSGFGPRTGTNRYDGSGTDRLDLLDDLLSPTSVTSYASTAASSGTSLTANDDYYLVTSRGVYEPAPYRRMILHGQGALNYFGDGLRVTEVAGSWGYQSVTVTLADTTAEALDSSETGVDVSGLTDLDAGQTILVDGGYTLPIQGVLETGG